MRLRSDTTLSVARLSLMTLWDTHSFDDHSGDLNRAGISAVLDQISDPGAPPARVRVRPGISRGDRWPQSGQASGRLGSRFHLRTFG